MLLFTGVAVKESELSALNVIDRRFVQLPFQTFPVGIFTRRICEINPTILGEIWCLIDLCAMLLLFCFFWYGQIFLSSGFMTESINFTPPDKISAFTLSFYCDAACPCFPHFPIVLQKCPMDHSTTFPTTDATDASFHMAVGHPTCSHRGRAFNPLPSASLWA